jgi:hypothetical protein
MASFHHKELLSHLSAPQVGCVKEILISRLNHALLKLIQKLVKKPALHVKLEEHVY